MAAKKPASVAHTKTRRRSVKKAAPIRVKKPSGKSTDVKQRRVQFAPEPLNTTYDRLAAKDRPKPRKIKKPRKPLHLDRILRRWWKPVCITLAVISILALAASPLSFPVWGTFLSHDISVTVFDNEYALPVPNPVVTVDGEPVEFELNGAAILIKNIPTGTHTIQIAADGYEPKSQTFTLKPTSSLTNDSLQDMSLRPTKQHLQITLTDAVSRLPISAGTITVDGRMNGIADGKASIAIPPDAATVTSVIAADGYDNKTVTMDVAVGRRSFDYALTPSGRVYYFTQNGSGADLYSVALDGTNATVALPASGTESVQPVAVRSPDLSWVAFTSDRNSPGLAKLFIFNTATGSVSIINDDYARFSIVGWTKQNTLIYKLERQTSDFQPANKYQIHRYNPADGNDTTIYSNRSLATNTSKNYKRDQEGYVGIYEELYADPIIQDDYLVYIFRREAKPGFGHLLPPRSYIVIADVSGKTIRTVRQNVGGYLYPKNLGNGKISYIDYSSGEKYFELDLATGKESQLDKKSEEPAKVFHSPNNSKIAWAQNQNGVAEIFVADTDGTNQKTVAKGFGLSVQGWFKEDYIILDSKDTEFSVQVVAVAGGHPLKLASIVK